MTEHTVLMIAGLMVLGGLCQWLAWRVRLPAILFLLISGILVGPVAGWLQPDKLLGDLLFPFVSLAVAVILFEGSLTLKLSDIAGLEGVVRKAVTTGALTTWVLVTLTSRLLTDLSWGLCTLFGAIMVVTGPTVIVPMLRTVRPTAKISHILRWEGIIIDPIGALLAVLVFEWLVSSEHGRELGMTLWVFLKVIIGGSAIGVAGGYLLGEALRRDLLPGYLYNVATLSAVVGVFGVSDAVSSESGLLAVTVMGIYLANRKGVPVEEILAFKESLSLLLITALFILLAARLDLDRLQMLGWAAVQVFLVIQFIVRPVKIGLVTWKSSLNWREKALLSWIAPRGIVAAAVASLFSLRLVEQGDPNAAQLVPLTFVVIIGTVVLQSLTARPLAKALKVAQPGNGGFLILGANPLGRAIASALRQQKLPVLLADSRWRNVSQARMEGFNTYYGSPLSEHAETTLDLSGLGQLLALTDDAHLNELACMRFRGDFGPRQVFALKVDQNSHPRRGTASKGREAFGSGASYANLSRRLQLGAEVRRSSLSENYTLQRFLETYGARATPLFYVDPKGRVEVCNNKPSATPGVGWSVIALIDPEPAQPCTE